MDSNLSSNTMIAIEQEYHTFLAKLDLLKKEQEQLLKEYREKLGKCTLLRLSEQLHIKE